MRIVNVMISKVQGGVEQAFDDYGRALALKGHDVLAVMDARGKTAEKFKASERIEPYFIRFNRWNLFLLIPLYFELKKFRPDLIILHSKKAIDLFSLLARLLKIKTVAVAHNPKLKKIDKCDAVFSITQYQKDIFVQKGLKPDRVFVIPNMIDDARPLAPAKPFAKPPVIGVIGRFDPMKGFPDFIRALGELKRENIAFKGVIGGAPTGKDRAEYDKIVALIQELNLQNDVELLGWFSNKDDFYGLLDVFVLSSNYEPFGIVLLEAMVRSKTVVSSLAEGPREIFADNTAAYTFPAGDWQALAKCLKAALSDQSAARQKAVEGYNLVRQRYLLSSVAEKLDAAVRAVKA